MNCCMYARTMHICIGIVNLSSWDLRSCRKFPIPNETIILYINGIWTPSEIKIKIFSQKHINKKAIRETTTKRRNICGNEYKFNFKQKAFMGLNLIFLSLFFSFHNDIILWSGLFWICWDTCFIVVITNNARRDHLSQLNRILSSFSWSQLYKLLI